MSKKQNLQLALDTTNIDKAIQIVNEVIDVVDVVEIGTPLIKSLGTQAIVEIRKIAQGKPIVADMKTMDYGDLEATLAFESGADAIIIQAAAANETLERAYGVCLANGMLCYIDSIGLSIDDFLERISGFPKSKPVFHVGVDQQRNGKQISGLVGHLKKPKGIANSSAIAGGLNQANIKHVIEIPWIDTFIIGGAIMKSTEPRKDCEAIYNIIKRKG